jgi:galactokinase
LPRGLVDTKYAARRRECAAAQRSLRIASFREMSANELARRGRELDKVLLARARHVVSEIERVSQAERCLAERNWPEFGRLMNDSHRSLREDFEVSSSGLDSLVEIAQACDGVYGSRMTGAGFGGCTVSLIERKAAPRIQERVRAEYRARTGRPAETYLTAPAGSVRTLRRP